MNRRERLDRAYRYQEMDRPAVYSRRGYPPNDPTYDRLKAYIDAHTEIKLGWNARRLVAPYEITESVEPYSADFERHVRTLRTPAGDLRATHLVGLKNQPGLHETYFVNSREDAIKYLSLPLPEISGDVSTFFATDAVVGDRGIADVNLGFNAAGLIAELCGSTNFAMMTITDRDILHAMCEREMTILLNLVRHLLSHGVGPYFSILGQEYIVPPLHGPRDFDDFNVRYDKPVFDLVHDAGGRMHVHSHGRMKQVVGGFLAMGADVLHPFEAPPMGDITPAEAKAAVRGRICLEGNIQINEMYESTPEAIRAETEALIATCFDDRCGLIVSPTASPYIPGAGEVCFPQYQAMVETVLAWKP